MKHMSIFKEIHFIYVIPKTQFISDYKWKKKKQACFFSVIFK